VRVQIKLIREQLLKLRFCTGGPFYSADLLETEEDVLAAASAELICHAADNKRQVDLVLGFVNQEVTK
jgi:hypothetical protein